MNRIKNSLIDILILAAPIVVISFFYSFSLIDPVLLPKYIGWGIYLLLFGLLLHWQSPFDLKWTIGQNPVLWGLLGYLLISGISLFQTRNLPDGFFEWFKGLFLLCFVMFLMLYFRHRKTFLSDWLPLGIVCLTYIAAVFGFYQFLELTESSGLSHSQSYSLSGTFAHRNLYGEILFLTFPFNLFGYHRSKGLIKWVYLLGAILALFIIIILMSRAVWLAVFVSFLVCIGVYGLQALREGTLLKTIQNNFGNIAKVTVAILFIIGASVFIYSRFDSASAFRKQVVSIFQFNFTYGSIKDRIDLWSKSWTIIKEHPVKGVGLGDWEQVLLKQGNKGMLSEDNKTFFQRPHNDFLWVCSESGIFGMLSYMGLFGGAFYMLIARLWKPGSDTDKALVYTLLFALSGYLTYALFSFPKERIEHQVMLGFILALTGLQFKNEGGKSKAGISGFMTYALAILMISGGVYLGTKRLVAEQYTHQALKARMNQNPEKVIENIRKAENPYYRIDPTSTPLRWYSGSTYYKLGEHGKALRDFQKAYQYNPYHMHVVNNLGTLYQVHGKHDSAIKYYNKALELSPNFTTAAMNLAAVHYNQSSIDKALKAIRSIPYQEDNEKFEQYLTAIIRAKTEAINKNIGDEKLSSVIDRMLNDNDWLKNIYKKSLKKYSFKHQLLEDVIYVLENNENDISFEQAKKYRKKYLNND